MPRTNLLVAGLLALFLIRLDWRSWEVSQTLAGVPDELLLQVLICVGASVLFYLLGGRPAGGDDS